MKCGVWVSEKLFIFPVLRMKSSLSELRDFYPLSHVLLEKEDLGFQICFSGSLVALFLVEAELGTFVNEF